MATALRALCLALGLALTQACDHHPAKSEHGGEAPIEESLDADKLARDLLSSLTENHPLVLEGSVPPLIGLRDFQDESRQKIDTQALQEKIRAAFLRTRRFRFTALTRPQDGKEWLPPDLLLSGRLRAGEGAEKPIDLSLKLVSVATAKVLWTENKRLALAAFAPETSAPKASAPNTSSKDAGSSAEGGGLPAIAESMIDEMIKVVGAEGVFEGAAKPPLALRRLKNYTEESVDAAGLEKEMRDALKRAGKFQLTTEAPAEGQRDWAPPQFLASARLKVIKKQKAGASELIFLFSLTLDKVESAETVWMAEKEIDQAELK